MDVGAFTESIQRGFGEIPPIVIALALLAGPTVALIGYRLVSVARRMQTSSELEAEPFWVCRDCRSVNVLRHSRCYRCGVDRDSTDDIEIVVDQVATRSRSFDVPAGSPFAAVAAGDLPHPGVPVMADPAAGVASVAVGPGHAEPVAPAPAVASEASVGVDS
jgi:hypothetical protein